MSSDIRPVLELLNLVFGPLVDADGRRLLNDRLDLSYKAPFLLRLSMVTTGFIPGFVWEEDGQVIGNVSLVESKLPGRYLIANVAVHPDHRRRGIARALMQCAVRHIVARNGREVLLQVDSENASAHRLYTSLDFALLGRMGRWSASATTIRQLALGIDSVPEIRPLSRRDRDKALELDRRTVDPDLNWPIPPVAAKYDVGFRSRLSGLFGGKSSEIWVAKDARGELVGLASIFGEWGRPRQIELRTHAAWRGRLERPLLAKLLRRLRYLSSGRVQISHPPEDDHVTQLLNESNFRIRRTLTVMRLDTTNRY